MSQSRTLLSAPTDTSDNASVYLKLKGGGTDVKSQRRSSPPACVLHEIFRTSLGTLPYPIHCAEDALVFVAAWNQFVHPTLP